MGGAVGVVWMQTRRTAAWQPGDRVPQCPPPSSFVSSRQQTSDGRRRNTHAVPHPIRSARAAEEAARLTLVTLGFTDARLTRGGPDGGVDVDCSQPYAQVKAQVQPVPATVVQQTFGVATAESKRAAVFALAGFTPDAVRFADRTSVALFPDGRH